jgi:hypothetical protein
MTRLVASKRIATSVIPKQYDLTLEPDLGKAVFSGSVTILYDFHDSPLEF